MSGNNVQEQISNIQEIDPIGVAEEITGNHYKECEGTSALGCLAIMAHGEVKNSLAKEAGDTSMRTKMPDWYRILEAEGFRKVFEADIEPRDGDDAGDKFQMYWSDEGILVMFDTYWGGESMNGGRMYYNWQPNEGVGPYDYTSSGGYPGYNDGDEKTHCGYRDIREFFRHNLNAMRENGSFLPVWKYSQQLWAISYGDQRKLDKENGRYNFFGGSYERVILDKLHALPEDVKTAIQVGIDDYEERLKRETRS